MPNKRPTSEQIIGKLCEVAIALEQPHRLMADVDPALDQQVLNVRKLSGKRTYIRTTSRITSSDGLK